MCLPIIELIYDNFSYFHIILKFPILILIIFLFINNMILLAYIILI